MSGFVNYIYNPLRRISIRQFLPYIVQQVCLLSRIVACFFWSEQVDSCVTILTQHSVHLFFNKYRISSTTNADSIYKFQETSICYFEWGIYINIFNCYILIISLFPNNLTIIFLFLRRTFHLIGEFFILRNMLGNNRLIIIRP